MHTVVQSRVQCSALFDGAIIVLLHARCNCCCIIRYVQYYGAVACTQYLHCYNLLHTCFLYFVCCQPSVIGSSLIPCLLYCRCCCSIFRGLLYFVCTANLISTNVICTSFSNSLCWRNWRYSSYCIGPVACCRSLWWRGWSCGTYAHHVKVSKQWCNIK